MLPQVQSLGTHLPPSILPCINSLFRPSAFLSGPFCGTSPIQLKPNLRLRFSIQPLKCSVSVASEPTHLELTNNEVKPFPAEVSKTIMELSSVGTLSSLSQEGWPLGVGVRFAVDSQGTPVLSLNDSSRNLFVDGRSSLHVQLEQCGLRTPQCSILGILDKPGDTMASKRLQSLWKRKFGEEVDDDLIYIVSVERVLLMEDFGEDVVWVTSTDYKMANPDPLRDFAEKLVVEINAHNAEDVYRFCNVYSDLDFQVLDAKMVWVDRFGFDIRVKSTQDEIFEVRIPFPREVTDEKGAKSSFNGMSQLAWEVEKNFLVPDFKKTCVLSMNVDCPACKMAVLEVLSSIIGVYSVDIDASEGQVKVSGEVDPNVLLKALARTGKHAKLAWAKLNHPVVHRTYHGSHHSLGNYSYGALEDPYHALRYRRASAFPRRGLPHPHYCPPSSRFRPFCY